MLRSRMNLASCVSLLFPISGLDCSTSIGLIFHIYFKLAFNMYYVEVIGLREMQSNSNINSDESTELFVLNALGKFTAN
jgi:hypothetical protein